MTSPPPPEPAPFPWFSVAGLVLAGFSLVMKLTGHG